MNLYRLNHLEELELFMADVIPKITIKKIKRILNIRLMG